MGHELHWLVGGLDAGLDAPRERLPLIADVGRTASGERLLAGIGPVLAVTVLVRIGGKPYLTRGAMLSYHELVRPAGEGLTDEGWQALLAAGHAPGMPEWAGSFILPNHAAPQLPAATGPLVTAPAGQP
ncbi:MAG: DUF3160 domain-containing protein [Armatimonadetes bacterium]|nr:DUF3160 domain-containing protein [Armatimonadota bacterium]